ncbi:cupin domain-containing protein [Archaeoglobus veneficus]|uniref:Cupin 2 conserved barrel domain protein n=1 Tax=Archaeoglobus veneficus (strain DSM 11195 / SNP6) TaxID=693661 RepID=F2KP01_ARCVS|nr:cupin domain-containing protein [Archaeoglobus veneficus]AEA46309.1 Cupin 2 conserved barrel domain protein [Archaeoglobus veneficus SNP6]
MRFEGGIWEDRGTYRVMRVFDIADDSYVQIAEIKPCSSVGKHYHEKQTEVFVVLNGEARLGIGSEEYVAKAGDIFLCKPFSVHWVVNERDEPFKLLVFKYGWVKGDIVWVDGG